VSIIYELSGPKDQKFTHIIKIILYLLIGLMFCYSIKTYCQDCKDKLSELRTNRTKAACVTSVQPPCAHELMILVGFGGLAGLYTKEAVVY